MDLSTLLAQASLKQIIDKAMFMKIIYVFYEDSLEDYGFSVLNLEIIC